jgi:hypothetical protein
VATFSSASLGPVVLIGPKAKRWYQRWRRRPISSASARSASTSPST